MKPEGKIDRLRALECKICSVTLSLAECYHFEKLMIQSPRMLSYLITETTATLREIESGCIYCI